MTQHINNQSKPLIFLGSNGNLNKYKEVCDEHQIPVYGIIDSDYYGNTEQLDGIPVIDNEEGLRSNINFYRDFNFFCATNWIPVKKNHGLRNLEKRKTQIELLDNISVDVISLVDSKSKVSTSADIGKGCFIDAFVLIEPNCIIKDYVNLYAATIVGHHTHIGKNSVLQRRVAVTSNCTVGENCYFGPESAAQKHNSNFGDGTFIHECIYIRRGTVPGEIVSMPSANARQVYSKNNQIV